MNKNLFFGLLLGLASVSAQVIAADGTTELLLSGPVEGVDLGAHLVTVLGQRFTTNDPESLTLGESVNVYGTLQRDGSISDAVVEKKTSYVAGSDAVFVKGVVQATNDQLGQLRVGSSVID